MADNLVWCKCCGRLRPKKTMANYIGEVWSCKDGSDCLRAEDRRRKRGALPLNKRGH